MILIGIGANLPSGIWGAPRRTCGAAMETLEKTYPIVIRHTSSWYSTAPVPISDQPWFVNCCFAAETEMAPEALMAALLEVETRFGRVRGEKNAARVLDLDLIAYGGVCRADGLALPHPRLHERAFVVLPILEIAPDWRHPATGTSIADLAGALPEDQEVVVLADGGGMYGTEWTPEPAGAGI